MPGFITGGRLAQRLVLNRWFLSQLGAESFEELKNLLRLVPEGAGDDSQSHFFDRLVLQDRLKLDRDQLAVYDRRVLGYEHRLARHRRDFRFRYFQYLAVLAAEVYLDRLTQNPTGLLNELNEFLSGLQREDSTLEATTRFEADDLRRMAFFMATGSGKTLLLHVNIWQVLHYLEHGRYPEALVRRMDGRRAFNNILLVTPGEGLSDQHLKELKASGLNAGLLVENRSNSGGLFGPMVKVIEIHKLAEEPSKDGVSIVLEELQSDNLVIVDEGHKGTASEEKKWKDKQQRLCRDGFLLEYSATFSQAIGSASPKRQEELLSEYGKAILFDYGPAKAHRDPLPDACAFHMIPVAPATRQGR
ncbi:MAG: DEAD/DEAH box helicase family protein, partial [candidate division WOR-3 bacterium]